MYLLTILIILNRLFWEHRDVIFFLTCATLEHRIFCCYVFDTNFLKWKLIRVHLHRVKFFESKIVPIMNGKLTHGTESNGSTKRKIHLFRVPLVEIVSKSKVNRVSTYWESTVSKILQKVTFSAITLRKILHEIFGTV